MSTADFLKRSLQTISLVSGSCGPLIPVPSLVLTLAASGGEFHPKMVASSSSQPTTRRAEPSASETTFRPWRIVTCFWTGSRVHLRTLALTVCSARRTFWTTSRYWACWTTGLPWVP